MAKTQAGALLGRDAILAATDIVEEDVHVPQWGGTVRVRGLTGAERDQYEAWIISGKGKNRDIDMRNARAKLVMMSCVDADGRRLFDEADVRVLGSKSALAVQIVFDVASRLSGLDEDEIDKIRDSVGNAPSDASGSA